MNYVFLLKLLLNHNEVIRLVFISKVVPKDIPDRVVSCLENSRFHWGDGTRDYYTPIYSLMVEAASESGAEG